MIETDAPDGLLRLKTNPLFSIPAVPIAELEKQFGGSVPQPASLSREGLNHPANIHSVSFFFLVNQMWYALAIYPTVQHGKSISLCHCEEYINCQYYNLILELQ